MCDDRIVVWYDRIKPGLYNTPLTRNMKATEQGNIHLNINHNPIWPGSGPGPGSGPALPRQGNIHLNINQHVHKIPIVVIENKGAVIMVLQVGDRD